MDTNEQLAMIERVGVGRRDTNRAVLWFDVTGDGWGALQLLDLADEQALSILGDVYESKDLNGRMCVVTKDDGIVRFQRLLPAAKAS